MKNFYLEKILDEFPNMSFKAVVQQKYNYGYTTYEELYKDYLDRYKTIEETQELCTLLTGADIYKLDEFKNKQRPLANDFLVTLFASRNSVPSKPFIAKCKRIRKGLEALNEQVMQQL